MKNGFVSFNHQRVTGVVSPLEANDRLAAIGKQVDDLPLPFVTPLDAEDDDIF